MRTFLENVATLSDHVVPSADDLRPVNYVSFPATDSELATDGSWALSCLG